MASKAEVAKDWVKRAGRELSGEARIKHPDLKPEYTFLGEGNEDSPKGIRKGGLYKGIDPGHEIGFYGHFLPNHFKKTRIIETYGR